MYKDKYIYPAIFEYDIDGISISFPDLPGCFSCGADDEEALYMAKDVLGLYMADIEDEKEEVPAATKLSEIKTKKNQRSVLVEVWMPTIRKAINNKAVKKTLTIPQWLDQRAKEQDINFSYVLQEALKKELNISR